MEAPCYIEDLFDSMRPNFLAADRDSGMIEGKENRETRAVQKFSTIAAQTGVELVDQWNAEYLALAFPSSIPRVVGGADFPHKKNLREEKRYR